MRRHHRQLAGFTLIELSIVLGLFGVLAAIAVPNINTSVGRWRADEKANQIRGFILAARNDARVGLRCVAVDVAVHQLSATTYTDANCTSLSTPLAGGVTSNTFGNQVTFSNPGRLLVFNGQGSVVGTHNVIPLNASTRFRDYHLKIWPAIGAVRSH